MTERVDGPLVPDQEDELADEPITASGRGNGEPVEEEQQPEQQLQEQAPDPVRHNDRVLIIGKTQSGKSVLARHLATYFTGCRLTLVDPKAGDLGLGVEPARRPEELDLAAPVSHYVPTTLEPDEYEELFSLLWQAKGPRMIWLDECFGPTKAGFAPQGLRLIVQQGARHDIGLIACTQRPVNIESTLRTEPEHIFVFVPALSMIDLKSIAPDMSLESWRLKAELEQLLDQEGLFSHLWYCRRTGALHRCSALPHEWARTPAATPATADEEEDTELQETEV
jgi:hypothetical protein